MTTLIKRDRDSVTIGLDSVEELLVTAEFLELANDGETEVRAWLGRLALYKQLPSKSRVVDVTFPVFLVHSHANAVLGLIQDAEFGEKYVNAIEMLQEQKAA